MGEEGEEWVGGGIGGRGSPGLGGVLVKAWMGVIVETYHDAMMIKRNRLCGSPYIISQQVKFAISRGKERELTH